MSRETLDGDGQPVAGDPVAPDLDLSLDDLPPVAPPAGRPHVGGTRTGTPTAGRPAVGRGEDGPAAGAAVPDAVPARVPVVVGGPAGAANGHAAGRVPEQGTDLDADPTADLDGFSVDLGEERVDRREAARAAGSPLTSVDRRRVRLAGAAAGAVLLLVLAAVGGYTEGRKAQDRDALDTARVVGQLDEGVFRLTRDENGALREPVPMTLHLTVSASVTGTLTGLALPTGEARLQNEVVLGPGPGADAEVELRGLCNPARPVVPRPTATIRTADGTEVVLPLLLGIEQQFLSRESLCAPDQPQTPPGAEQLQVEQMSGRTDGTVAVSLHSLSDRPLMVIVIPSTSGNAAGIGWTVAADPAEPVTIPPNGSAEVVVRLTPPACFPDRTLPLGNNLIGLRVVPDGGDLGPFEVDGVELSNWDDAVVAGAAAARSALNCRK